MRKEEEDFYRRIARGPITVYYGPRLRPRIWPPQSQEEQRQTSEQPPNDPPNQDH